jgi:Polyketide cyclase / dehydrase and lipid transport
MGPLSAEIEIDVPRQRAFEFVGDLANRPSFTDHFISDFHLSRLESSGVGAGARFRFFAPPQAVWMDTTIAELDEPHRIVEHGRGGRANRVPSTTVWELVEGSGRMTKVRVAYWTEPSHHLDRAKEVLGAASVWYQRDWREALRRLRDILESGGPAEERVAVAGGNRYATGIP